MNTLDYILLFISWFCIGYLLNQMFKSRENKRIRKIIYSYIILLSDSLKRMNNKISVIEFDDRYIISSDIDYMKDLKTIKLFKYNKELLIDDKYLKLTDKEYADIFDLIKSKL